MDGQPMTPANYCSEFRTDGTPPIAPTMLPARMPSGRTVDRLHLRAADVDVFDIARILSHTCRWAGCCRHIYTVAQHSLLLSRYLSRRHIGDPDLWLWALLHDAGEAYLGGDVTADTRMLAPRLVAEQERALEVVIRAHGLSWPMPDEVAEVDERIRADEWRDLMPGSPPDDVARLEPLGLQVRMMMPDQAERYFLRDYEELRRLRGGREVR